LARTISKNSWPEPFRDGWFLLIELRIEIRKKSDLSEISMQSASNGVASPYAVQAQLLEKAKQTVQVESFYMKRCLVCIFSFLREEKGMVEGESSHKWNQKNQIKIKTSKSNQNTKTPKHQNQTKTPKHQNTKTPKHQNTKTKKQKTPKQKIKKHQNQTKNQNQKPKHQNTKTPKHQNTKTKNKKNTKIKPKSNQNQTKNQKPKHQNTKTPKHQNTGWRESIGGIETHFKHGWTIEDQSSCPKTVLCFVHVLF